MFAIDLEKTKHLEITSKCYLQILTLLYEDVTFYAISVYLQPNRSCVVSIG